MTTFPAEQHATTPDNTTTVQGRRAENFAEWKAIMSNRFGRLSLSTWAQQFHGEIRSTEIDGAYVTEISASPHEVQRKAQQISAEDPTHLKLSLLLSGSGLMTQDGRTAILQPGDLAVYDTSRPYTFEFTDDVHVMVMVFPHNMLGMPAHITQHVTAVPMPGDSGLGKMVSPFLEHMATNLDQLQGVSGKRIMHSAIDLIAALLSAEVSRSQLHKDHELQTEGDEYRLFIESNLHDPELNSEKIAKAHFISTRKLQYVFSQQGQTVSSYIRARRLERCRLDLMDPAYDSLSINQIATRWGLLDSAHFSRIFKTTYGMSPSEYRHRQHTGLKS